MSGIKELLSSLEEEHRLRQIPADRTADMLDLSSNDYLSLGARSGEFREEFLDRFSDAAFTSSASRLLSSKQKHHNELESYLESLYNKPTLLFNSGYHANMGCIGALSLPGTMFICDKLIHASVIDGLNISRSSFRRFPHNDFDKLAMLVEKEHSSAERIVIVVESIYSMDGDEAPLSRIVNLKKKYPNVLLYVDEAHAFGVRGIRGLGLSEEIGIISDIDVLIGTFGKAAASAGAFAVCSPEIKSLLINCARPFIFSTALPPANVAWSHLMTEKIVTMSEERARLAKISAWFSDTLQDISGMATGSSSQIIPYLTGDAAKAMEIAGQLKEACIVALPIRRPTVPPGGERIRFSLGADMTMEQLLPVFEILKRVEP